MIGTNIIILYSLDNDKAWQSYLKKNSQAKNRTEFLLFVFPSAIYVNSRINKPVNTLVIWQINTLLCLYYSLSFSENMAAYLGMKATFLIERISNCHYHHCTDESSVKPLVLPESAVILNVENNAKMILIFQSLRKFSHCKQRIVHCEINTTYIWPSPDVPFVPKCLYIPENCKPSAGVHFSLDVLPSWDDRGSCAHKCVY